MSWKMFWTLFGASLSVGIAAVPTLLGVAWWWIIVSLAIVAISAISIVGSLVRHATMFALLKHSQRDEIAAFMRLGILVYWAWSVVWVIKPEAWLQCLMVLPLLATGIYWGARGIEYKVSHEKPKAPKSTQSETLALLPGSDPEVVNNFRAVLNESGFNRVEILSHEEVQGDSGGLDANQFLIKTPPTSR